MSLQSSSSISSRLIGRYLRFRSMASSTMVGGNFSTNLATCYHEKINHPSNGSFLATVVHRRPSAYGSLVSRASAQCSLAIQQTRNLTSSTTSKSMTIISKRNYGGKPPFTIKTISDRVMLVLQLFDKVNPQKVNLDSHFINDLGLDSLDHVEIMLALEKEFMMEIPDADAERLMTPKQVVQYICDAEDVFE